MMSLGWVIGVERGGHWGRWGHRRWQCSACSAECQQQYSQQGDPEPFPFLVTLWLCHILVPSQAAHCCCVLGTCLPGTPATHHMNQQKHLLPIMAGDSPIPQRCQSQPWRGLFQTRQLCLAERQQSTFLYEADRNFKPWMGWDLHRPPSKPIFLTTTRPLPVSYPRSGSAIAAETRTR